MARHNTAAMVIANIMWEWWIGGAQARIMMEEGEVGDFDTGMVEYPGRGKQHRQPDFTVTFFEQGGHYHRFTDKSVEQREG